MPRIDIATAPVSLGSDYPAPFDRDFVERRRIRLGDAAGLTQFGVNLTTLPPGGISSLRHWHEVEEEMVLVLEGRLTLVEDGGEVELVPGESAGFPAASGEGHHFLNRGPAPAVYLEIGTRPAADRC
ncbi:MAG: cupin domain-containing protein, partial [Rhodobacteraceae bacterium]|nr:cupin domain-containing protein [Paracoccaceae bacterium]